MTAPQAMGQSPNSVYYCQEVGGQSGRRREGTKGRGSRGWGVGLRGYGSGGQDLIEEIGSVEERRGNEDETLPRS